jgi:hypothetical protein
MNLTEKIERKIMPNLETAMIEISSWKKNKEKIADSLKLNNIKIPKTIISLIIVLIILLVNFGDLAIDIKTQKAVSLLDAKLNFVLNSTQTI